ncbi:MAG: pilus assembly protein [Amphiplicatus sp.]
MKSEMRMAGPFIKRVRRAAGNRDGMAATEFALILPLMASIFFGMLEISDAMMASRRVVNATNALADLVTQEKKITTDDVPKIFEGAKQMLEPTDSSGVAMSLVSIKLSDNGTPNDDSDDKVVVEWSRDNSGGAPYAVGADYDKLDDITIIQSGVSLIVSELTYQYKSGLTSKILGSPITFDRMASRWPRRSTRVKLCTPDGSTCW